MKTTTCTSNALPLFLGYRMILSALICEGGDRVSYSAFVRADGSWCTDERRWCVAR